VLFCYGIFSSNKDVRIMSYDEKVNMCKTSFGFKIMLVVVVASCINEIGDGYIQLKVG